jgi:ATP-dependent DNA helicase RecG
MSLADEQDSVHFSISGNSSDQTHGSRETTEKSSQKSSQRILELVAADDKIPTQEMADKLDISRRAVAKAIAKLRSAGILRRVGPDKGGYWEIISTD